MENVKVPVNEELTYGTEEFQVTFRIEGEVRVPVGETEGTEGAEGESTVSGGSAEGEAANAEGSPEAEGSGESGAAVSAERGSDEAGAEGADSGITVSEGGVSAAIESDELEKKLEFRVDPLDENSEEYAKAAAALYAEGTDGEEIEETDDQLFLRVLSYGVMYDGVKLDLSDCVVTAEVTPSQALVEYAETVMDPMTLELDEEEEVPDDLEIKPEVVITAVESKEGEEESGILDAMVVNREALVSPMLLTLSNEDGIVAVTGTSQANPHFTVQYYAYIDRLASADATIVKEQGITPISVIDTSGRNLPTNKGKMPKKDIYVAPEGTVLTESILTEIYSSGEYEYILAPGLVYFNKIAKNDNYKLAEIRVLRSGSETWESYDCKDGKTWHFTNKQATQSENKDEFILITANATIRLVYEIKEEEGVKNGEDFYDYDVSDGKVYTYDESKSGMREVSEEKRNAVTAHNEGETWYMFTQRQGINSNLSDQTFGFGNSEGTLKTGMGELVGNKANADNASYGSPTFGLVTGLKSDGTIEYASTVKAPSLFNETEDSDPDKGTRGKTSYVGDLVFRQRGDTYTLTGAEVKEKGKVVSSVYDVDKFKRQRNNWNNTYYFAGNDFYPMDGVHTAGTGGHDLMFGASDTSVLKNYSKTENGKPSDSLNAPASDDGKNHNHYFGMHYTVSFNLVEDYVGPLEYLFYGDDDMWVFLSGSGTKAETNEKGETVRVPSSSYKGKLICDIGGVHSAIGEYVNLWDYIDEGTEGEYTLTFFYTE
ncbi:MAG: hypothetical protein K2O40_07560, partial [Lachnospiraceae bacterium]|nr:hypothetical protein [Lachnospiraceae bacterium]